MMRMVHLCCNDDSGNYCGKLASMQILGLDLAPAHGWPVRVTIEASRFRIGRRWYAYRESEWGVGNIYWNGYWMRNAEAKRLLRDLKASGKWVCEGGPARLYDWYERAAAKAA